MVVRCGLVAALVISLTGCGHPDRTAVDPGIAAEIDRIRAIDNHAHPVRVVLNGAPDREFDALPVDNMEPASDPLNLRPNAPATLDAIRALYGSAEHKSQLQREKADAWPAWVLDE